MIYTISITKANDQNESMEINSINNISKINDLIKIMIHTIFT